MYYHYYESAYAEDCPEDFLFEAKSDEEALNFVAGYTLCCDYKGYTLNEITEPRIEKNDNMISLEYDFIRTVKKKNRED